MDVQSVALIVLFVIATTVVIFLVLLTMVSKKWAKLQQFVSNYVGGVWAKCSITDFNKALKDGSVIGGMVAVPETIIFALNPKMEGCMSGYDVETHFDPFMGMNSKLFVPFISERFMTFDEQRKFFIGPQNPQKFIEEKFILNAKNNWRLAIVRWVCTHDLDTLFFPAVAVMAFSLFFAGYIKENQRSEETLNKEVPVYTTSREGILHEVVTTEREAQKLPMYHRDGDLLEGLFRGKVSEINPLGGGVTRTCITQDSGRVRCGFATSSLKFGEEAFVRFGSVLMWSSAGGRSVREPGSWLITSPEAAALVATGKFTIADD